MKDAGSPGRGDPFGRLGSLALIAVMQQQDVHEFQRAGRGLVIRHQWIGGARISAAHDPDPVGLAHGQAIPGIVANGRDQDHDIMCALQLVKIGSRAFIAHLLVNNHGFPPKAFQCLFQRPGPQLQVDRR